jgi:hypothetical protein
MPGHSHMRQYADVSRNKHVSGNGQLPRSCYLRSEHDMFRYRTYVLRQLHLYWIHYLCRDGDLPDSVMRDCADLRRDAHLSVAHLSGYSHLRCGDLSGFGDLQGFPNLPRLRNLSRDRDVR